MFIFYMYDHVLLDSLEITGTNKKESYSIPFMQLARLANRNNNAFTETDRIILNNVLSYKAMRTDYTPRLADSVKNTYKKEVTEQELKEFWEVYFKYMRKYPKVYIAALVNSTYGYYFPEVGETRGIEEVDHRLGTSIFKIKNLDKFKDYMKIKEKNNQILEVIPFINFFNHLAYYTNKTIKPKTEKYKKYIKIIKKI